MAMDNSEFILVFTSAGSQIEANKIAEVLIKKRLAACVSIFPGVTSHYCWNDRKEEAYEVMVMIKALRRNYQALEDEIREVNSYEEPEILMVPIAGGSDSYLKWMKLSEECAGKKEG
ncbi:MAG: divalent cation tolerance protein CutA [candidate division Zixibacteria bacterium]|nr:divalent cation tolerance protein CutA [candidate division Zixibacteria bacterium]